MPKPISSKGSLLRVDAESFWGVRFRERSFEFASFGLFPALSSDYPINSKEHHNSTTRICNQHVGDAY
eukprot:4124134-Amphidinium_carterae.1